LLVIGEFALFLYECFSFSTHQQGELLMKVVHFPAIIIPTEIYPRSNPLNDVLLPIVSLPDCFVLCHL